MRLRLLFYSILLFSFQSCSPIDKEAKSKGMYISVLDFLEVLRKDYSLQPYSQYRIVRMNNGKADTSITTIPKMDWPSIAAVFAKADISDAKFDNKYTVSEFPDVITGNQVVMYEAKTADLFTRSIMITIDKTFNRIQYIYIHTSSDSYWKSRHQNLTIMPHKLIQIQDAASGKVGGARSLSVEYRFLQ